MILTKEQTQKFEEAAKPLVAFLNNGDFHPHITVAVTCTRAELSESIANVVIEEYLKD